MTRYYDANASAFLDTDRPGETFEPLAPDERLLPNPEAGELLRRSQWSFEDRRAAERTFGIETRDVEVTLPAEIVAEVRKKADANLARSMRRPSRKDLDKRSPETALLYAVRGYLAEAAVRALSGISPIVHPETWRNHAPDAWRYYVRSRWTTEDGLRYDSKYDRPIGRYLLGLVETVTADVEGEVRVVVAGWAFGSEALLLGNAWKPDAGYDVVYLPRRFLRRFEFPEE